MAIETIKLSEKERTQLIMLKRKTKIENWNVLCRWALCASLSESSEPPEETITSDSSIEMTWKTFTGGLEDIYLGLIRERIRQAAVNNDIDEQKYMRLHLNRGISYLLNKTHSIDEILRL